MKSYLALYYTTVFGAFAQESIKINENSSKGIYFRVGGGYSLGTGKTSGSTNGLMPGNNTSVSSNSNYQSRFGTVNTNISTNTTTKTNAAFSLGEGINMALGIGYMFNSNIGLELSGNYFLGTNNSVENKTSTHSYRNVAVSSGKNKSTQTVTKSSNTSSTTSNI